VVLSSFVGATAGILSAAFIEALDRALSGRASQAPQQAPQGLDPRQIVEMAKREVMQDVQQRQLQAMEKRQAAELQAFAQSHEFLDDVRDTMADLIEVAAKRGASLSYEDAYNRAVMMHPDIAGVMKQREAAAAVANAQASTQRARAAASSVRSAPTVAVSAPAGDDLRSAIEAAFARHSGR